VSLPRVDAVSMAGRGKVNMRVDDKPINTYLRYTQVCSMLHVGQFVAAACDQSVLGRLISGYVTAHKIDLPQIGRIDRMALSCGWVLRNCDDNILIT